MVEKTPLNVVAKESSHLGQWLLNVLLTPAPEYVTTLIWALAKDGYGKHSRQKQQAKGHLPDISPLLLIMLRHLFSTNTNIWWLLHTNWIPLFTMVGIRHGMLPCGASYPQTLCQENSFPLCSFTVTDSNKNAYYYPAFTIILSPSLMQFPNSHEHSWQMSQKMYKKLLMLWKLLEIRLKLMQLIFQGNIQIKEHKELHQRQLNW